MESFDRSLLVKKLYDSGLSLFNIQTLKDLWAVEKENTLLVIIKGLVKSGILEKAEKGKFYLASKPPDDFSLAHFLYQPSYISLETGLNLHQILSQFPYEITSVTTKKKKEKLIAGKAFVYLHLNPGLFWGYFKKNNSLIAEPEKAVLDTLYLASKGERGFNFDEANFAGVNKRKLLAYARQFPKTRQFLAYFKKLKSCLLRSNKLCL